MDEEEQFVNIDLNDDNICSVCKLETETGTLSFCHVCFELSIEGKKRNWRRGSELFDCGEYVTITSFACPRNYCDKESNIVI
uniref:Uncharacterized protein n=1 Tax=Xiphophorus couchianus TaxID=32473 RepID=A0A3B5KUT0_9TELE